jgi:hypothetical protein
LRRNGAQHRIDTDLWLCVLDVAALRGWIPLVTPADQPNGRSYARPVGMTISAEDARNLAQSIQAELPSIHDKQQPLGNHAFGEEHTESLLTRRAKGEDVSEDDVRAARELLSGSPKREAEQLTAFLLGGGFSIATG